MPDAPTPTEIVALLRLALRHGDDPNVRACLEAVLGWLERQAPVVTVHVQSRLKQQGVSSLPPSPSAFLTVRMAADVLGVSRQTIYNLCNDGRLPAARTPLGGAIRIRRGDLDAFIGKMYQTQPLPPVPEPEPEPEPPKRTRMKTIFRPDGTPDIAAMVKLKAKMRQLAKEERWLSQDGVSQKEKPK